MNLLILESPGKVKKVKEILGQGWNVVASVGHVRDLPLKELGVSLTDFTPTYVPTERGKGVLARLKEYISKADSVYLATDPDREGEAIAWHLVDALKIKQPKRVTYTEITASAIQAAVAAPRTLDMNLVSAQEARRVLDRLCGYLVSPVLSGATRTRLSAGRVQSPAVRLVVERERAIRQFKPVLHFGAELTFDSGWRAVWQTKDWHKDGQDYFLDKDIAEKVAAIREVTVLSCKTSQSRVAPPAPFTTSSLQQAASNALRFSPKRTMQLAQALYEGGHITYMRTDSPNLSAEAVASLRDYCAEQGWPLVDSPRTWKSKASAQEAHEAIRPTHCEVDNAGKDKDEQALYALIRQRTLASQLADAIYDVCTVDLSSTLDGKDVLFEAKGRVLREDGWKVLTAKDDAASDAASNDDEADNPVPSLQEGASIHAISGRLLTKQTKAPSRYTEASLVRELENRGIGRPATFAAIIDTIMQREYVRVEKRNLVPTPAGEQIVDMLTGQFAFIDYEFTSKMESNLDDVASGAISYGDLLQQTYEKLHQELEAFQKLHPQQERPVSAPTEYTCEVCGNPLLHVTGKKRDGSGELDFFACSDKSCNTSYLNDNGKPGKARKRPQTTKFKCKTCGAPLLLREGQKGPFFACSAYPKCKQTYAYGVDDKPVFMKSSSPKGGAKKCGK